MQATARTGRPLAVEREAQAALDREAAPRAELRPVGPPVAVNQDRVVWICNDGKHEAAIEFAQVTMESRNGSPRFESTPLPDPIVVGPGDHGVYTLRIMAGSGPATLRIRWSDGRIGVHDRTWSIDLTRAPSRIR